VIFVDSGFGTEFATFVRRVVTHHAMIDDRTHCKECLHL